MRKVLNLYFIAVFVGLLTGLVASLLQLGVGQVDLMLQGLFTLVDQAHLPLPLFSGLISMTMVLVAWLAVRLIATDAGGSGIPEIEGALLHRYPIHWHRLIPVKFFGGILSLSAKMVMGREGPTIQLGGNIGQMVGDFFRLSRHRADTLIAAGSAAGLAAAFNAPLAGVLFVMEEMRNQFSYSFTNLKMVIIASVAATMCMQLFIGTGPSIQMEVFELPRLTSFWMFLLFGVIVGAVGLAFNIVLVALLKHLDKKSIQYKLMYILVVGFMVGLIQVLYPDFVGGGYNIISNTLNILPSFNVLLLLLVIRFATTMFCYSTGVPGGIFAPLLAMGTLLGFAVFHLFSFMGIDCSVHPGMFAVAGMGALFAAAVRSPITGVALVVEMTQNYLLILPLMVSCIAATTVVQIARNPPIYAQLLKRALRLNYLAQHQDKK